MPRLPLAIGSIALLMLAAPSVGSAQAKGPDLSDPEVAHVAVTANSIDIELGRLAEAKARRKEVREFAATMVRDHGAVNAQAGALAARLGVSPADNAVSRSLQAGAAEARKGLEKVGEVDFDKAYLAREVGYHQAVLDALDGVLIPTTEHPELRKLLVAVRPAIAAHLAHAKHLQATLEAGK
jgi:putative membrane protein